MPKVQEILPPKLQEPIENLIKNEGFSTYSVEVKDIEPDGSFVGVLREINITGTTENGDKELKLFIKTMIDGFVDIYSIKYTFENETYMYAEFSKIINEIQEEAKVPLKDRFKLAESYMSTDNEVIIMEDLKTKGFTMCPKQDVVPLKYAELAMEQLAKYHSFAFIIKKMRPDFFETKIKKMKQPFYYGTKQFNDFAKNFSRISILCLTPEQKEKIDKFMPTTYDKYAKYTQDTTDTWTMVHGDYRHSNIMVKFRDDEAEEVMPIDFQHAFYGCSIIDLIYFIISGTDQEFRKNHMDHLKNLYHESMKNFLQLFDMDIEDHYPREEFERLFKERLDYGLMVALWLLPVVLAKTGEVPDVTRVDLATCDFKVNDLIKERIQGVVNDYIQWGYI